MADRRVLVLGAVVALWCAACSLGSSSEVASTGRQAVDAAPTREFTSVVARAPVNPLPSEGPAVAVVPRGSLPDVLAFKDESAAVASADAERSTTTTAPPAASPAPEESSTTTEDVDVATESSTTTTVAVTAPEYSSVCPPPVFDIGFLADGVQGWGDVDGDGTQDLVAAGFDGRGKPRIVVDFGDGGQSELGRLGSFGDEDAPLELTFTGSGDRPIRVSRGSSSVLVWVEGCTPLRAANG